MSKRFGRNQRRRARLQVAALEQHTQNMTEAMTMDRGLLAEQSETIRELRTAIHNARKILGPYSAALPLEDYPVRAGWRDSIEVYVHKPLEMGVPGETTPTIAGHRELLSVFGVNVYRDEIDHHRHACVRFNGMAWDYAITPVTLAKMPPEILAETISSMLALQIVDKLSPGRKPR